MPPTVLHLVIIITVTDIVIHAKVIIISVIYYNRSHLIHDVNPSQLSAVHLADLVKHVSLREALLGLLLIRSPKISRDFGFCSFAAEQNGFT